MLQITKCAILLVFLVSFFGESIFVESSCSDWASYKDEKCFRILDNFIGTYDEAEKNCAKLEDTPTLAIVHSKEEQDFLSNYLFKTLKKVDNFWIGAKSSNNTSFKWVDNTEMNFSNWVKAPKNKTNYCVQMQSEEDVVGKWTDEPCEKRNAAVCQKMQTWSIAKLQKSHLEARKEFKDALDEQKQELDEANKQIAQLKQMLENEKKFSSKNISELIQNIIPIGFLYTQLPNEKPPTSIWPSVTWTDVSSTYAGVFFRVEGGGSESFGQSQAENDRRVIRMETSVNQGVTMNENKTIDVNTVGQNIKTSEWVWTGSDAKMGYVDNQVRFRLVTSTGEIRPRNMAIRVWKRTG